MVVDVEKPEGNGRWYMTSLVPKYVFNGFPQVFHRYLNEASVYFIVSFDIEQYISKIESGGGVVDFESRDPALRKNYMCLCTSCEYPVPLEERKWSEPTNLGDSAENLSLVYTGIDWKG